MHKHNKNIMLTLLISMCLSIPQNTNAKGGTKGGGGSHGGSSSSSKNDPNKAINIYGAKAWNQVLEKNMFKPYTIEEAYYNWGEQILPIDDVTPTLQAYASQGIFPSMKEVVIEALDNQTLSEQQKDIVKQKTGIEISYPLDPKKRKKILEKFQTMNFFFGRDPKNGKKKELFLKAILQTAETKSLPAQPIYTTYEVRLPESDGNFVYPKKTTEPTAAAQPNVSIDPNTTIPQTNQATPTIVKLTDIKDILEKNDRKPFSIIKAWYGAYKNNENKTDLQANDVTELQQKYASKGILLLPNKMNDSYKDPIYGTKKILHIECMINQTLYIMEIPEQQNDRGNYELPKNKENEKKYFVLNKENKKILEDKETNADAATIAVNIIVPTETSTPINIQTSEQPVTTNNTQEQAHLLVGQILQAGQLGDVLRTNNRKPFKILDAWYGFADEERKGLNQTKPIITTLQKLADKGIFAIPENAWNFFGGLNIASGTNSQIYVRFQIADVNHWYEITYPADTTAEALQQYNLPENTSNTIFYMRTNDETLLNTATLNTDAVAPTATPEQTTAMPATTQATEAPATVTETPVTSVPTEQQPTLAPTTEPTVQITQPDGTVNQGTVAIETTWPASGKIALTDLDDILPTNNQMPFKILNAWYGVEGNANNLDVTKQLQEYADKGIFVIPNNMNDFFKKDPIKNIKKTLYMRFMMQGNTYEISIPEHKSDRQDYELPKKIDGKQWFVVKREKIISETEKLAQKSYHDRFKNILSLIERMQKNKDIANNPEQLSLLMNEAAYIIENYTNQELNKKYSKDDISKLLSHMYLLFIKQNPLQVPSLKALATKYGFSMNIADAFKILRENIEWDNEGEMNRFIQIIKNIAALNQQDKLVASEIEELISLIKAAQLINNDQKYKAARDDLQIIHDNLQIPVEKAPTVLPDPIISTPEPTVQKTSESTYEARIGKLIAIKTVISDMEKDACLGLINELVRDRAYASKDQMIQVEGIISYYSTISPYFKNDATRIKALETAKTTLNSGILYEDRLLAAKAYVDKDTILKNEQQEFFTILQALAEERGKANSAELGLARAFLITAQKRFNDTESKDKLSTIEAIFNTPAPVQEVKTAEEQAIVAAKPIEVLKTEEAKQEEAKAQVIASNVIETAAKAAITEQAIPIAENLSYSNQILQGYAQIFATHMNPTQKMLEDSANILKKIVGNRYLATADDTTSLQGLLQYAGNISDKAFAESIKELTSQMGVSLNFSTKLKAFNDVITRTDFTTNITLQEEALRFIQRLIKEIPTDASLDLIANIKGTLIAAQSLFSNETSKKILQELQQNIILPTINNAPVIEKPLQQETTKTIATLQESITIRIAQLDTMRSLNSSDAKTKVLQYLDSLIKDRPRASQESINSMLEFIASIIDTPSLTLAEQAQLKSYQTTLSRPATATEEIEELEEMNSFETFADFHTIEMLRIIKSLSEKIQTLDTAMITRIRALLLTLKSKVHERHQTTFNQLKAIIEAPIQIVAPTATVDAGEKIPTTVTTAETSTQPLTSAISTASITTPSTPATTTSTETNTQPAVIAAATAAATATTAATTIIMQKSLSTTIAQNATTIDGLKKRIENRSTTDPLYQEISQKITTLEEENRKLQEEMKASGQPSETTATPATISPSSKSTEKTVPLSSIAARSSISTRGTTRGGSSRGATTRRTTSTTAQAPATEQATPRTSTRTTTRTSKGTQTIATRPNSTNVRATTPARRPTTQTRITEATPTETAAPTEIAATPSQETTARTNRTTARSLTPSRRPTNETKTTETIEPTVDTPSEATTQENPAPTTNATTTTRTPTVRTAGAARSTNPTRRAGTRSVPTTDTQASETNSTARATVLERMSRLSQNQ